MVIDQLDLEAVPLPPTRIHTLEHFGPVLAFGATRPGVDLDVGAVGIRFACEKGCDLVPVGALGKLGEAANAIFDEIPVALALGELNKLRRVGELALKCPRRVD